MSKDYDPRMHSAEHVLNGVMMRRYGCPRCFSTHINPKKSKVDFHFPDDLTDEDVRAVEAEVNAVLARHLDVTALPMPRDEAARRFNLSRLPDSAGDTLRIVYVGDPADPADACPCTANTWPTRPNAAALSGCRTNGMPWKAACCECVSRSKIKRNHQRALSLRRAPFDVPAQSGSLEHFAIEMLYGVGKAGLPLSLSVKALHADGQGRRDAGGGNLRSSNCTSGGDTFNKTCWYTETSKISVYQPPCGSMTRRRSRRE